MVKTTPTQSSDQIRTATASDGDHSKPSSAERARAINAARFGKSYAAALKATQTSAPRATAHQSIPAPSSAPNRPPITNRNLPNMSRQMSSRHQLPNGRSRTGFNTPAEVREAKTSAYRKFPAKAHALELAARERRGVERVEGSTVHQQVQEEVVEEETGEGSVVEVRAVEQREGERLEQDEGGRCDSEYESDA